MARKAIRSTPEENTLMALVRGLPLADLLRDCRREVLSGLALKHKVFAPLAEAVTSEPACDLAWRRWAASVSLSVAGDDRRITLALAKTIGLLEAVSVAPVVLKGPSLAFGRLRDIGDADLLIEPRHLETSIAALEAAGYVYRGFERNTSIRDHEYRDWERLARWSNQFEFSDPETGTLVELHTALFETGRVYVEDLAGLRDSVPEMTAASVVDPATRWRFLSLEDRVVLLALHAGLKRSPARRRFILRQVLDLRALAQAGPDWSVVLARAARFGALHHLLLLLLLQERFLPGLLPQTLGTDIGSRLSARVVRLVRRHFQCLVGVDSYDPWAVFTYRFLEPFLLASRWPAKWKSLSVIPLVVPSRLEIAHMYHMPPRSWCVYLCYLLEPFRWARRGVRKVFGLRVETR